MKGKQPKLVLREACIHDLTRDWTPGRFVEMGAGAGAMTRIFLERGFHGTASDLGEPSRQAMRANLRNFGDRIEVVDDPGGLSPGSFDYLLAFEVLEHIPDDAGALGDWVRLLKPGGRMVLSVPAHQRKFGRSDELVGHVRRYEREQLRRLLAGSGLELDRLVNYGFPVTELTRRVSNWMVRNDHSYDTLDATDRSIRSAHAKPLAVQRLLSVVSGELFRPFVVVQRWFYARDWGDGLVATATRR